MFLFCCFFFKFSRWIVFFFSVLTKIYWIYFTFQYEFHLRFTCKNQLNQNGSNCKYKWTVVGFFLNITTIKSFFCDTDPVLVFNKHIYISIITILSTLHLDDLVEENFQTCYYSWTEKCYTIKTHRKTSVMCLYQNKKSRKRTLYKQINM